MTGEIPHFSINRSTLRATSPEIWMVPECQTSCIIRTSRVNKTPSIAYQQDTRLDTAIQSSLVPGLAHGTEVWRVPKPNATMPMLGYLGELPALENNSSAWLSVADVIVVPHQTAQLSSLVVQILGKRYNASLCLM
jgi:hypothetical protein